MTKNAKALGGTVNSCAVSDISQHPWSPLLFKLTSFETQVGNDSRSKVTESALESAPCSANAFAKTKPIDDLLEGICHEKVAQSKSPELPSRKCLDEVLLVKVLVGSFRREWSHTVDGKFAFFLRKELCGFRVVGHVEVDEDAPENGGDTFEDEAGCQSFDLAETDRPRGEMTTYSHCQP